MYVGMYTLLDILLGIKITNIISLTKKTTKCECSLCQCCFYTRYNKTVKSFPINGTIEHYLCTYMEMAMMIGINDVSNLCYLCNVETIVVSVSRTLTYLFLMSLKSSLVSR